MIVWAPPRRSARNGGLGDALPSWYSVWTDTGHNDGGPILAFVQNPGSKAEGLALAASTGRIVPFDGGYHDPGYGPYVSYYNPINQSGLPINNLWLNEFGAARGPYTLPGLADWGPGDDAMAAAIQKWVLPALPANPMQDTVWTPTGGPSNVLNASNAPKPSPASAVAVQPAAPAAGSSSAASGSSASSSSGAVASGFDLSSVPWWAWALGVGVVLFLAMRD